MMILITLVGSTVGRSHCVVIKFMINYNLIRSFGSGRSLTKVYVLILCLLVYIYLSLLNTYLVLR